MSARSDELRRQRDLLRENLAWLEREIAAEEGGVPPAPPPPVLSQRLDVAARDADRDAEAILAEFRTSGSAIESQTKRGCILYFAFAVLLLAGAALAAAYYYGRARHGP